ncbi:MAG TPA: hypothetical protein VGN64_09610, partial [Dyadobacter sp.]|nr:hypothetical protein [Dyadobacter sp.]
YDKRTKKFALNRELSNELAGYEVKFDSIKHQVITANRFGCCEHQWKTYRYINQQLKLVKTKTEKNT